jgi:adenylate cyclase
MDTSTGKQPTVLKSAFIDQEEQDKDTRPRKSIESIDEAEEEDGLLHRVRTPSVIGDLKDGYGRKLSAMSAKLKHMVSSNGGRRSTSVMISEMDLKPPHDHETNITAKKQLSTGVSQAVLDFTTSEIIKPSDDTSARKRSSTLADWFPIRSSTKSSLFVSSGRQRSSTSCGSVKSDVPPVPVITQVLQNTSIFKQDPDGVKSKRTYTVTTNDNVITEDSLIMGAPRGSISMGTMRHIKAFTVAAPLGHGSISSEAGPTAASAHERKKTSFSTIGVVSVKDDEAEQYKRAASIATFFTPKSDNKIQKVQQETRRPSLTLDSLRVPRRWFSLRNVLSFFNILILTLSILVISLISYFSNLKTNVVSVNSIANVSVLQIVSKLDTVLNGAVDLNLQTESIISTPEYPITNSIRSSRFLYAAKFRSPAYYNQIYAVNNDSYYLGISSDRDGDGEISTNSFVLSYSNRNTKPYLMGYRVDSYCKNGDFTCTNQAFIGIKDGTNLVVNKTFSVQDDEIFQYAVSLNRTGWTPVYRSYNSLMLTCLHAVVQWRRFLFVAGVEVDLRGIGPILQNLDNSLNSENTLVFLLETNGNVLSSSKDFNVPVLSSSGERVVADRSVDTIRSAWSLYKQNKYSGITITYANDLRGYLVMYNYKRFSGDIDWIVGIFLPNAMFFPPSNEQYLMVPIASAIVLILATVCSIVITKWISRPLKKIAQQMLMIAELDFSVSDDASSIHHEDEKLFGNRQLKEVQYLESAMNSMKSALRSFSKYVPLDIVTLLVKMKREAVMGVDELDITVFFSDIVDFTSLSESVDPKVLVQLMSEYLGEMTAVIGESSGVVDKYIGDSVMAFWNAPISQKDHPTIACSAALKCHMKLQELNIGWKAKGYPQLEMRIGVNSGMALVGNVGSWFRLNYTCLGDTVNLGSRLESLNKKYGTCIMISEYTYNRIHKEYFVCRPLDTVKVKGKQKAVKVYELVGFRKLMTKEMIHAYLIYEEAYDLYIRKDFLTASDKFEKFIKVLGKDDVPARKHLQTCQQLIQNPPDETWNGIVLLDEK